MNIEDFNIFKNIPEISTERLTLRKITKKDLDDIFEYSSDPEVSKYLLWRPHENKRETRTHLNNIIKKYKAGQFYDWGIIFDGKMIGTCGFSKIDILSDTAEAGYVLSRPYWGRGIAPEALLAVINFGFNVLGLRRIECICIEENKRSLNVMKKCGMKVIFPPKRETVKQGEKIKNIIRSYIEV